MPPEIAVQVKICGLTNLADAQSAVEAGADLLGFIFYEKSPRYVLPETVREIVMQLKDISHVTPHGSRITDHAPRFVGVFVNLPASQILDVMDFCGLDLAQLHGEEDAAHFEELAGRAFKALRPRSLAEGRASAGIFAGLGPAGGPDLLVDAFNPALRGGAGETGDWQLAAELARRHRLLLAGGLRPDNVAAAIRQVRPWGVDTASGVEAAPGRKDHARLRAFVAAAKPAFVR